MAAIILAIGVFGIIMMSLPSDAWMELMPNSREFLFNSRLLSQPHLKSKMGYISGAQTQLMGTPHLHQNLFNNNIFLKICMVSCCLYLRVVVLFIYGITFFHKIFIYNIGLENKFNFCINTILFQQQYIHFWYLMFFFI